MKWNKKVTASIMAMSMSTGLLSGLPVLSGDVAGKLGLASVVSAAEARPTFIDPAITARMVEIRTALVAISQEYPQDLANVRAARDQVKALDPSNPAHLNLINPTWNQVKFLFQPDEYQEIREDLLGFVQALAITYYGDGSELENIALQNQFNDTARKFALKAGVDQNIRVSDFAEFIFGNDSYTGVEPIVRKHIKGLNMPQIYALLEDDAAKKEFMIKVLKDVLDEPNVNDNVIGKILSFYAKLSPGILPSLAETSANFEAKIPAGRAAGNAMLFAVMRTESEAYISKQTGNGRKAEANLKVLGREVPSMLVEWSVKKGTTPTAKLTSDGDITIEKNQSTGSVTAVATVLGRPLAEETFTLTAGKPGNGGDNGSPQEEYQAAIQKLTVQFLIKLQNATTEKERTKLYQQYYKDLQELAKKYEDK
ncbi:hypothetical protein [Paenibacillus gansuensis]|uniref:SbsC C-terminal domain-containing protein n=1 Tax=Paenibacillus gansuensis TaxID=306542 RepID=A0ABW5P775_9BACL